jgi:fumarate hydratase subunit beta
MSAIRTIRPPLSDEVVRSLHAGDEVHISGVIFTARDAAHKRFVKLIENNQPLPVDLRGQILYYTGPTPAAPGKIIGSAGPTTSCRMDPFTPQLIQNAGVKGMIGKGGRGSDVIASMKQSIAVYFAAIGGAGALIAQCIRKADIVCYNDLGAEAVYRLTVEALPVIVAIDCLGNNLYVDGRRIS